MARKNCAIVYKKKNVTVTVFFNKKLRNTKLYMTYTDIVTVISFCTQFPFS